MTRRPARPSRIGRPPAADSGRRRELILLAARERFARHGYAGATLSGIAADAGISLPALYHYFSDRTELYEAVFERTAAETWTGIARHVAAGPDGVAALGLLVQALDVVGADSDAAEDYAALFLVTVPVEAARHPELRHLLERRRRLQERQFRALTGPVFEAGLLPAFADLETAVEAIRLLVMGWASETYLQRTRSSASTRAVLAVLRDIGRRPAADELLQLAAQPQ